MLLRPMARNGLTLDPVEMADAQRRAAVFREIGRDLNTGHRTDRAMSIGRAMEKAFRAGVEAMRAQRDFDPVAKAKGPRGLATIDISPRARSVFETISLNTIGALPGEGATREPTPIMLVPTQGIDGRAAWILITRDGRERSYGATTISPLVKLGLLAPLLNDPRRLTLSHRGLALVRTGGTSSATTTKPAWGFPD